MVCKKCLQEFKKEIEKLQIKSVESARSLRLSEFYEKKKVYPVDIFSLMGLIKKWEKQLEDLR